MNDNEFVPFPKIPRLSREIIVSEKIDGTNSLVAVSEEGEVRAGSKNRWLTLDKDNYGFARWVKEHEEELRQLGPGRHHGEWWGNGIQRKYGLSEKRFSLFNTYRWSDDAPEFDGLGNPMPRRPACCHVVPVLYTGDFETSAVIGIVEGLRIFGSTAVPGFMRPEGVIVFHTSSSHMYKKTVEDDDKPKGVTTLAA